MFNIGTSENGVFILQETYNTIFSLETTEGTQNREAVVAEWIGHNEAR